MKVWIVSDEYDYFLTENEWSTEPCVDIEPEFWERYQNHQAEKEYIQSKLHRMYEEAERKKKLDNIPKADYSKPF
jgi:hypothetical protein